jgi:hypothetical protein
MIASEGHDGATPEVLGKEEGDGAAAVVAYGRAAGGRARRREIQAARS